jgi:hypothetical protein
VEEIPPKSVLLATIRLIYANLKSKIELHALESVMESGEAKLSFLKNLLDGTVVESLLLEVMLWLLRNGILKPPLMAIILNIDL